MSILRTHKKLQIQTKSVNNTTEKWAKIKNKLFSEEEMTMSKDTFSISDQEIQIESTTSYHFTP